jgi:NAD(P)-dependent dehydrogenase (short-subunit alcohol dehydrogenase family)
VTHGIETINRTTAAESVMRLLIIGATGGTGLQVTRRAVEGGHNVTAFGLRRNSAHCVSAWWSVRVTHAASPICGTSFLVTTP